MSSAVTDYEKKVKKGVRAALNTVIPGMGISSNALRLISLCLSKLDSQMVDESRKFFAKRKNPTTMPVCEARKAVIKILPDELLPLAEAAANKCIMRYNAGLLQYYPPLKKDKRKKSLKTKSKLLLPEFTKCVPAITRMVHEDISVQTDAKTVIGAIMQKLVTTLMEKVGQVPVANTVTPPDIVRAVENCMNSNVAKHAISEGARTCLMFTNEQHKYMPDDFEKLRRNHARRRASRKK